MFSLKESTKSLLYFLIFTIISSSIAFYMVIKTYDEVFELGYYGQ